MSAKHAVLGLMLQKPRQPSQASGRLVQLLGGTWKLNSGQLSQIVKYLEQHGMIELLDDDLGTDDEKRVFAGTAAGADEFERWFATQTSWTRPQRRPPLVKLLVAVLLGEPELLEVPLEECKTYEQECATRLEQLSRKQEKIPIGGLQIRAEHELLRFSLGGEILTEEEELKWARYMQDKIARLKSPDVIWPSTSQPPTTGTSQERRHARDELFDRIAERQDGANDREPQHDADG
jgi:DNA-binding PadR family transcriptional regulator